MIEAATILSALAAFTKFCKKDNFRLHREVTAKEKAFFTFDLNQ